MLGKSLCLRLVHSRFVGDFETRIDSAVCRKSGMRSVLYNKKNGFPCIFKYLLSLNTKISQLQCASCRLSFQNQWIAQIVVFKFPRLMRLVMIFEKGLAFFFIYPISESFTPPRIIFRNGMVLRQIESNDFQSQLFSSANRAIPESVKGYYRSSALGF